MYFYIQSFSQISSFDITKQVPQYHQAKNIKTISMLCSQEQEESNFYNN